VTDREALRFGIVSGDPAAAGKLQRLCDVLRPQLGRPIFAFVFPTFAELRDKLTSDELDIAWAPPIAAVQLELSGRASIAVGVWREGGSSYSAAVFTRAASPLRHVDDLRGKSVAWVDRESAAGYLLPRLKLASLGIAPGSYLESFAGSHEAVVEAVLSGSADAGATHVSFAPVRGNIESAGWSRIAAERDVRILVTAGPIPPDVIVIAKTVTAPELITEALIAVASSPATSDDVHALFAGRGFVMVGSYQYDGLRSMLRR
jgi:phosphonate transport system substrate-binding protein